MIVMKVMVMILMMKMELITMRKVMMMAVSCFYS